MKGNDERRNLGISKKENRAVERVSIWVNTGDFAPPLEFSKLFDG